MRNWQSKGMVGAMDNAKKKPVVRSVHVFVGIGEAAILKSAVFGR